MSLLKPVLSILAGVSIQIFPLVEGVGYEVIDVKDGGSSLERSGSWESRPYPRKF